MTRDVDVPPHLHAAVSEARRAVLEYDDACDWLISAAAHLAAPIAVEVWVFDPSLQQVLLVKHRWRGWVPPGGAVDPGEHPRQAALRELDEETGLRVEVRSRPAAVAVRAFHHKWEPTLGLSYAAVADLASPIRGEAGQPVAWKALRQPWESMFPEDRPRMMAYVNNELRIPEP
jgi:8-oxo-dGTP diphosphatase